MPNKKLSILLSPTHRCNMRCEYCYVSNNNHFDMSKEDFYALYNWLAEYAKHLNISTIDFTWFGGEPLLYGVSSMRSALELQSRFFDSCRIKCINRIQSNLTLINKDWCRLLKEYFSSFIGGSFEPFEEYRKYANGSSAKIDIEQKIKFLRECNIKVGIVCTLMKKNLPKANILYNWFASHVDSFRVNRAHSPIGVRNDDYMSVDEYNRYVLDLFDIYIRDKSSTVKFTNFDVLANSIKNKKPLVCIDGNSPWKKIAIAGNGEISSYCRVSHRILGNYYKSTPEEVINAYRNGFNKSAITTCDKCDFFQKKFCAGNCYGEPEKNCYQSQCGYRTECTKEIIAYIVNYLDKMKI